MDGPGAAGSVAGPSALCARWFGGVACRIEPVRSGGFSGQPIFRVETAEPVGHSARGQRHFALKAFSADRSVARARDIHAFVSGLAEAGVEGVALPLVADDGETLVVDGEGRVWEMCPWMPGRPAATPSLGQAAAALRALARIHRAAAGFAPRDTVSPGAVASGTVAPGPDPRGIPAWQRRVKVLDRLAEHGWSASARGPRAARTPLVDEVLAIRERAADRLARHGGRTLVRRLAAVTPPPSGALFPVLRDVWRDHVLFEGERVTGIIDPHAAGVDAPATDIARLLGSWPRPASTPPAAGLSAAWGVALEAYSAVRGLPDDDRLLVDLLDVAGVIGSLDNWFTWVVEEGRDFEDSRGVAKRVGFLAENFESALLRADALLRRSD